MKSEIPIKLGRNLFVDAAKLLFAFGVVVIHLSPNEPAAEKLSAALVTFAVPFFIIAALYFFIRKVRAFPVMPWRALHLERLWLPYIGWTLLYALLRTVKYRLQHREEHFDFLRTAFYGGSSVQLYFLTFLLLCMAWVLGLALIRRTGWEKCLALALFLLAGVFSYVGALYQYPGFQTALLQSWLYVGFAYLLLTIHERWPEYALGNVVAAFWIVMLLLGSACQLYSTGWLGSYGGPLAGYAACSLVFAGRWRPISRPAVTYLLSCAYGIYLAHFVFLEAFDYLEHRANLQITPYSIPEKLGIALFLSACCIGAIALLRLQPFLRLLLLGERAAPPEKVVSPPPSA